MESFRRVDRDNSSQADDDDDDDDEDETVSGASGAARGCWRLCSRSITYVSSSDACISQMWCTGTMIDQCDTLGLMGCARLCALTHTHAGPGRYPTLVYLLPRTYNRRWCFHTSFHLATSRSSGRLIFLLPRQPAHSTTRALNVEVSARSRQAFISLVFNFNFAKLE